MGHRWKCSHAFQVVVHLAARWIVFQESGRIGQNALWLASQTQQARRPRLAHARQRWRQRMAAKTAFDSRRGRHNVRRCHRATLAVPKTHRAHGMRGASAMRSAAGAHGSARATDRAATSAQWRRSRRRSAMPAAVPQTVPFLSGEHGALISGMRPASARAPGHVKFLSRRNAKARCARLC